MMVTDASEPGCLTGGPEDDDEFALGELRASDSESSMSDVSSRHENEMDLDNGQ